MFAVLAMLVTPAFAQDGVNPLEPLVPRSLPAPESDVLVNETPTSWFVELNGLPAVEGGSLNNLKAEKDTFRRNARIAGVKAIYPV